MEGFDLRSLQLQVESDNSIEHSRRILTEACHYFATLPDNDWKVKAIFRDLRENFPIEDIPEKDIFFYDVDTINPKDIPEEYKSYSLGLFKDDNHCVFAGRLVYPVRDTKGYVMGLCGWDPGSSTKYLDSRNYGYNAKNNIFYGLEMLESYYKSDKPVYIVEGIPCCNWLRAKGFQALAMLGSHLHGYQLEILKRFEDRCVLLPDNDESGLYVIYKSRNTLPRAKCYVSIVAKDIDDTRRLYSTDLVNDLHKLANPFMPLKVLRVQH